MDVGYVSLLPTICAGASLMNDRGIQSRLWLYNHVLPHAINCITVLACTTRSRVLYLEWISGKSERLANQSRMQANQAAMTDAFQIPQIRHTYPNVCPVRYMYVPWGTLVVYQRNICQRVYFICSTAPQYHTHRIISQYNLLDKTGSRAVFSRAPSTHCPGLYRGFHVYLPG